MMMMKMLIIMFIEEEDDDVETDDDDEDGVVLQVVRQLPMDVEEEKKTVLQSLLGVVDADHAPNYSLLLMWASLANAIPVSMMCSSAWHVAWIVV